MQKSKLAIIRDHIVKNSKFVFPVLVVIIVSVTVSLGLNANNARAARAEQGEPEQQEETGEAMLMSLEEEEQEVEIGDVPLAVNEDGEIYSLIATYYNAIATGDSESLRAIYDEISDNYLLYYEYVSEYMDYFPLLEIYTKPGVVEGDTVVYVYYKLCFVNHEEEVPGFQAFYVCRGENGLYLKNGKNLTDSEADYVEAVGSQDDVVEFQTRTDAEYYDLLEEHPELLAYLYELDTQVGASVGVALAALNVAEEPAVEATSPDVMSNTGDGDSASDEEEVYVDDGPKYATATTTVNVRSSDSEQADKIGKVSGGSTVQVQEVRVNGWTKVVYEGQDGYIKSEYLQMEESAAGLEIIGTVTATAAVNVRSAANESATRLGILAMGESLDLVANEGDWCKVVYNGKVGYVKAEYVQ